VVAVLGDSTFIHSGITGLINSVYNASATTVIILDNRITAMTGQQEHPGTGYTIHGDPAPEIDYEQLARALGVQHVRSVDPYNVEETIRVIREEVNRDAASVIVTKNSPCILLRRSKPLQRFKHSRYQIDNELCTGCRLCLDVNCPAISWNPTPEPSSSVPKRKGVAYINKDQCVGCELCAQICKFNSIIPYPE
jgi:indolepyruvate ferredoxin oxidoreductase alpha subunit